MLQQQQPPNGQCPPPPIDHLANEGQRPTQPDEEHIFDRKKGNPGPKAKVYEVVSQLTLIPEEPQPNDAAANDTGPPAIEEPMTENERVIYEAMKIATMLFPEVQESWLRKCLELRMVQDKWDVDRAVAYIFENENIAPRKAAPVRPTSHENLETHKENLFNYRHDVDKDYSFFAQVKLTEMFPNLSMDSIRRVFVDFRSHYMPTAITLAEALEDYFDQEGKSWDDFKPTDCFWLILKRDGRRFRYPMRVVKGMKCWSKKKGRTMGFPRILIEELKMADTWLEKLKKKRLDVKKKRMAEEKIARAVADAKLRGETNECSVCGSDYRIKEDMVRCTSEHEFCDRCLKNVCWEVIAGQVKLSLSGELDCFTTGCPGKFTYNLLGRTLEPEQMARLEEVHLGNIIMAANLENVVRCNYCSYIAVVEVAPEVDKVFSCKNPRCLRQVCRLCGDPWKGHEGRGCKPKELSDEALSRMKFEEAMTAILTRNCQKCKGVILKQGGCNKVTCRCGGTLCYMCRAPNIGYDHFCKHIRAAGEKNCTKCSGCMLFEDTTARDQEIMKQMRTKYELDRLNNLADTVARTPTPKTPTPAAPTPAQPANAQNAFQRQFG